MGGGELADVGLQVQMASSRVEMVVIQEVCQSGDQAFWPVWDMGATLFGILRGICLIYPLQWGGVCICEDGWLPR